MISANGGLPAHRYTPQVTQRWPQGFEPACGVTETSHRTPRKAPHQHATHRHRRPHTGPPRARQQRWWTTQKVKTGTAEQKGHGQPQPTNPEPHAAAWRSPPAGRARTEPNVYIVHPTHGAGTRPSRTQRPTAARKTTLNEGQCLRQPREGRGRNRQPPPPQKKQTGRGGGGAREQPTATKPPANTTRGGQTPQPEGTEDRTTKEAQEDHPAKTGNTKPETAAHRERGHQNMETQTTLKKKKSQQPSPKERGWGDRDHKLGKGTASNRHHKAKPRHAEKKKRKKHTPTTQPRRAGHCRDPRPARTPTHRTPARKGEEQVGRAHKHAPPHSNPNQEVQETTRDGRTSTHTPQHPPKERWSAAKNQTPAHTPGPHTRTRDGGGQAERARNQTCPISRSKPKPNYEHHKQPAKEGQHHKRYPNTPAQGPSQDWRG